MNNTIKHPDLTALTDLAEHRLKPDEGTLIAKHLADCAQCAKQYNELEHLVSLMRSDSSKDAPRDVIAMAINIFDRPRPVSVVRRLLAVLSFDSLQQAPAFGVRAGHTPSRQLLYSAENNDIDLRIVQHDINWVITGQVLGHDCARGIVELAGADVSHAIELNESCEFTLPAVPPGDYALRLYFPDLELEVPRLELRK